MPGIKKFSLGGVDLKSNDLIRNQLKASDLLNVVKNQKGDITTRFGYVASETIAGELEEILYRKSGDETVVVKSDGTIHRLYNGARQSCSIATLASNVGLTLKNRIVAAEYLSNLYITTTDGKTPLVKYDGADAYLAGVPAPTKTFVGGASTISSPGNGYFFRFYYEFKDLNGNITLGPYKQMTSTVANPTITVSSMKTANPYGAFFNKYLKIADTFGKTLTAADRTLTFTSTNYVVGDKFVFDKEYNLFVDVVNGGKNSITLTVESIVGSVMTFAAADFGTASVLVNGGLGGSPVNLDNRTRIKCFYSTDRSFGYVRANNFFNATIVDNSQDNFAFQAGTLNTNELFENVYNEEKQKLRPPLCKYVSSFGSQLIFSNIIGVWDQLNAFTQYNNDDIFMWSDFGFSDNGENHSGDYELAGETYNGSITGGKRCNDLFLLMKDSGVYAVSGTIEAGSFVVRKIPTNFIGCVSQNSIIEVEGGVFFQGNDGIYFSDGVSARKMTNDLDPFFNNIIGERTKATINRAQDKFIFYVTDGVTDSAVVFDYHFKEWFIWDSIDMSKGLFEKNDKSLFFGKATKMYQFNTNFSDDGAAIDGYYSANWEDLKEPSVNKKFKYVRIWNLSDTDTIFTMRIQKDWNDTADVDTVEVTIPAKSSVQKGFEQLTCKAVRFIFEKNSNTAPLVISAYEIEYEPTQKTDKGN